MASTMETEVGSHRYQPYQVPGARTVSGSPRRAQVGSTSVRGREGGHHMGSRYTPMGTDPLHPLEPPTIMSVLGQAWASGGKTIVPTENHPSHSMPHPSIHTRPPAAVEMGTARSGASQLSMTEMVMPDPVNQGHSREDSALWTSFGQTTMKSRDMLVQDPRLNPPGTAGFYSPLSTERGIRTPAPGVDQARAERVSSSVELQDSPLETMARHQKALSYTHALRMQQEEQLQRAREKIQRSTVQAQTPPLQHPLDPPQLRPHSLPMLPDHRLLDHTGPQAHLTRPSSRTDLHMGMGMGEMGLLHMGDIGLGTETQLMQDMGLPRAVSGLQAQMYPPPQVLPAHPPRGHLYPQEALRHRTLSPRLGFIPGDDSHHQGMPGGSGMGDMSMSGGAMGLDMISAGNANSYLHPSMFAHDLLFDMSGMHDGEMPQLQRPS